MAVFAVCLVIFFAMAGHSSGTFCICKDGLSDAVLQKDIDYACGAGADCAPISQSGVCYNPNTVKAHCDYAVNSYFQRRGQVVGSCDFSGTATQSPTAPNQSNGCAYPSTGGSTTPSTNPPGTPSTTTPPGTPSTTNPGTPSTTTPSTMTPPTGTGTTPPTTPYNGGMNPGTTSPSVFGLGPAESGITNTDSSGTVKPFLFLYFFTLWISGYVCLRV